MKNNNAKYIQRNLFSLLSTGTRLHPISLFLAQGVPKTFCPFLGKSCYTGEKKNKLTAVARRAVASTSDAREGTVEPRRELGKGGERRALAALQRMPCTSLLTCSHLSAGSFLIALVTGLMNF